MIKVEDVAYVRFAAPDLTRMKQFLSDFGLVVNTGPDGVLYSRGTDASPYFHIAEQGEAGFRGLAFEARTAEDLTAAAQLEGASAVEKIAAPGGGQRVRFSDPDGFAVEVVHGRELLEPLPVRSAAPLNTGSHVLRRGQLQRVASGPACVKRLGHIVVRVSDFQRSRDWYSQRFGFVASDEIYLGDKSNVITAFLRCDRGERFTDHHSLLCVGVGEVGFDHAAFEVEDIDAVMVGHDQLAKGGYDHHAGIGRHILGGQVFDYWKDPWGHTLEHFTDGDLLNDQHVCELHDPASALGTQWGKFSP